MALEMSQLAARTLLLSAQGLLRPPAQPATKEDVLAAIRRMGALQIDTISVVARSPYLVLWSRLGDYEPRLLDVLLAEGSLFEYWAHAACLLPAEHYPYFRRLMLDGRLRWRTSSDWVAAHGAQVERLLDRIRVGGAVRSVELGGREGPSNGWWDWKPDKLALEHLHNVGTLMTARRHNFQRVYDLRERVRPAWDDAQAPSLAATRRYLALQAVQALGVAPAAWVSDYFRTPKAGTAALLEALADEGALLRVRVEGWLAPGYVHPDNLADAEAAAAGELRSEVTTLLSPFDPIVWDRARAGALFGFAYTIECYTPAPKRRYGYFTLPILYRGALVGRLDPKAHRREGRFEVKAVHLEPNVDVTDTLVADLAAALRACAAWHRTPTVEIVRSHPPDLAARLRAAIGEGFLGPQS